MSVLIEAKAMGGELKDAHVKQALDYAATQGVDWVVLTTAAQWRRMRPAMLELRAAMLAAGERLRVRAAEVLRDLKARWAALRSS